MLSASLRASPRFPDEGREFESYSLSLEPSSPFWHVCNPSSLSEGSEEGRWVGAEE